MSWEQFLQYLSDPNAIPVVIGVVLSWSAEYIPGYEGLMPNWKRLAFLGLCLIVPTLAALRGLLAAFGLGRPTRVDRREVGGMLAALDDERLGIVQVVILALTIT